MTSIELIICAFLVFSSAYLASSEIALFSLSRFQLRALKEHVPSVHRKIKRLLGDPGGLLISILVVNEVINVALSAIVTHAVSAGLVGQKLSVGPIPEWVINSAVGTLITAPIVLFLCEITPKIIGARANQLVAGTTAGPLTAAYDLLKPVRVLLKGLVNFLSRLSGGPEMPGNGDDQILKESDFMLLVEEGHKEGAIHESELGLIKKVFELDNTTVAEIFKPLAKVQTLTVQAQLKTALQLIRAQSFSRIPVLTSTRKVAGILYSKDLLRAKMDSALLTDPVSTLMRKPLVVPATLRLNTLFRKFKQERTHMAIVQAENGEAIGIVTMADVLEALFEDLLADEEEGTRP